MIASLVVTLDRESQNTIGRISRLPGVEVGSAGPLASRLPITIDSAEPGALEEITQLLLDCPGVMFVDVVFVHFDNLDSEPSADPCQGANP